MAKRGRPKGIKDNSQFCYKGHDVFIYGRDKGGNCIKCTHVDPSKDGRKTQICPQGHDKDIVGRTRDGSCLVCRRVKDRTVQVLIRKKRTALGLCILCGKRPPVTEKQCAECNLKIKSYRDSDRIKVLEHYGNKCACCGESNSIFLSMDHIDGGGNKHRKGEGRFINIFLIKNNFPAGYQILCHNCNWAKYVQGKCPHQL
jgi:hypothetical protein